MALAASFYNRLEQTGRRGIRAGRRNFHDLSGFSAEFGK
jgi:hypothetical protein